MNNADFWASVHTIIAEGFTSEGLQKLDSYAEVFISGKLVYQRFSPQEQHGCAEGGTTNVIASLLAGAEAGSNSQNTSALSDYKRECQLIRCGVLTKKFGIEQKEDFCKKQLTHLTQNL